MLYTNSTADMRGVEVEDMDADLDARLRARYQEESSESWCTAVDPTTEKYSRAAQEERDFVMSRVKARLPDEHRNVWCGRYKILGSSSYGEYVPREKERDVA